VTGAELEARIALLRDNLEKLDRIPQGSFQEFEADFRNLDSALHRLQTSIQALMDIGGYLCAVLGLGAPATSREILERLEGGNALPAGSAARFGAIFGFRNRVVHLYERIDPEIVFRILSEERGELEELARMLLAALDDDAEKA